MILKPFSYVAPSSLQEACKFINEHDDAKVLAGGQSLLPILKLNLAEVGYLVDIKRIPNMSLIKIDRDTSTNGRDSLFVGALASHAEIAHSDTVKKSVPLLSETAAGIGHPLVRNRGTIGGSLSHCDPAADFCVTALALEATMTIVRYDNSRRVVAAQNFFTGTFTTDLQKGEILEKICFPILSTGTGYAFEKLTLGHGDFPLIVASVLIKMEKKRCLDAAIALGGVSDRAVRMAEAEAVLRGNEDLRLEDLDKAASFAENASEPVSDLEVSAAYKKRMVRVLVRRALTKALERSGASK